MTRHRIPIVISGSIPDDLQEDGIKAQDLRSLIRGIAREFLASGADLVYGTYGEIAMELELARSEALELLAQKALEELGDLQPGLSEDAARAKAKAAATSACGTITLWLREEEQIDPNTGVNYKRFANIRLSQKLKKPRFQEDPEVTRAFREEELIPCARALVAVGGRLHRHSDPGSERVSGVEQEANIAKARGIPVFLLAAGGGYTETFFHREVAQAARRRSLLRRNGLTLDENRHLGATKDPVEAADLVVRGLQVQLGGRPSDEAVILRGGTGTAPWSGDKIQVPGKRLADSGDLELGEYADLIEVDALRIAVQVEEGEERSTERVAETFDLQPGEVYELVWTNGAKGKEEETVTEWVAAEDLAERFGRAAERGADSSIRIPSQLLLQDTSRGLKEVLLKVVRKLTVKLDEAASDLLDSLKGDLGAKLLDKAADVAALAKVRSLEAKLIKKSGLYAVADAPGAEAFSLGSPEAALKADPKAPLLVLIHGTASNTANAFVGFRTETGRASWSSLRETFGERILAFEHYTLTQSPVQNALELARQLPRGARLRLLSHSRGGLVGDLLCLPHSGPEQEKVRSLVTKGFTGEHERIGELFLQLLDVLAEQSFEVERFARVASPSAGTLLASKRLDRYLGGFFGAIKLVAPLFGPATPVVLGAASFLKSVLLALVSTRAKPHVLPGLAAMIPGSPLVRLLAAAPERPARELLAVAGDYAGEGVFGRLKGLFSDLYYWEANDFVVDTDSMLHGLRRRSAKQLVERGPKTDHFSYFRNTSTARPIASWLKRTDSKPKRVEPLHKKRPKKRQEPRLGRSPTPRVDLTGHVWETRDLALEVDWANLSSSPRDGDWRPLLMGYYHRSRLIEPLSTVNKLLGEVLTRRWPPSALGQTEVYEGLEDTLPQGVAVVGLGEARDLTAGGLTEAAAEALETLALRRSDEWSPGEPPVEVKVDTLLLGQSPINGALSLRDSVRGLVEGALRANRRLAGRGRIGEVRIVALRFVELYEGVAKQVHDELKLIVEPPQGICEPGERVLLPQGKTYGSRPAQAAKTGWPDQRLAARRIASVEIEAPGQAGGEQLELIYDLLSNLARAERHKREVNLPNLSLLVQGAMNGGDSQARRSLFQYLLPTALSERLQPSDMLLVLDKVTAQLPWELLDAHTTDRRPLATRYGLVRQLRVDTFRERPRRSPENRALVIGEPQDVTPRLPGAKREAEALIEFLSRTLKLDVISSIQEQPGQILRHLYGHDYDVVHVAAHGEIKAGRGGVLMGDGRLLTACEFRNLRSVPSLVFLNCCYLGDLGPAERDKGQLAASLAQELISMGVRAVVVAGWAINDHAALEFAKQFYSALAVAKPLIEAVQIARENTFRQHPHGTTWAAYQVYGDPGFVFSRPQLGPEPAPQDSLDDEPGQ